MLDIHHVILHPYVTEKTMAKMESDNKLEFIVRREASKKDVKFAVEKLFQAKVESVNTRIGTDGLKHAVVRFKPETRAEEIGMRIGVF